MKLLADLHTHSKNSRFHHGKNKIEEMALVANEIGLEEIGITDHGYQHFFRTSKRKLIEARKIVDDINEWSKTKVLLGVEADIISADGTIDIDNETLSMLDILIVGYHKMIFTDFAGYFGNVRKTKEAKQKRTQAFINAINRYPVTIVSHLDSVFDTDLYEIGRACRERGTLVEINNRHTKWKEEQVNDLLASGCLFVVSSDAHSREDVGVVNKAFDIIKKYNIPSERIVNVGFAESEKSDDDRIYNAYRSIYEKIAKKKREREEQVEVKKQVEFDGNLSKEMENALREIAKEKGIKYTEAKIKTDDEDFEEYVAQHENDDSDDEELIAQAEEYIRKNSINRIEEENESLLNVDGETELAEYRFNDDHPLLKEENFENKFQAINNLISEVESEEPKEIKVVQKEEPKVEKPAEVEQQQESKQSDMQRFEALTENISKPVKQTEEKPVNHKNVDIEFHAKKQEVNEVVKEPVKQKNAETFMDSITRMRLVNNGEPEKEEVKEVVKEPKKEENKPEKKRTRGLFVSNNLIDESKK